MQNRVVVFLLIVKMILYIDVLSILVAEKPTLEIRKVETFYKNISFKLFKNTQHK